MKKLYLLTMVVVVTTFGCFDVAYGKADEYLCDSSDNNCFQCQREVKRKYVYVKGQHKWDGNLVNEDTCYECRENGGFFGDWVWRKMSCSSMPSCQDTKIQTVLVGQSVGQMQIYATGVADNFIYKNVCRAAKCQKGDGTYADIGDVLNIKCDSTLKTISSGLKSQDNLKAGVVCVGNCTAKGWDITIPDNGCAEGTKRSEDHKSCVADSSSTSDSNAVSGNTDNGGGSGGSTGGGSSGTTIDTGAETACISTGGTWTKKTKTCTCDNAEHLIYNAQTKGCVCNVGYALDTQTNKCVATSKTQCEAAGQDTANWIDGKCVCVDPDMIWSSNGCVVNPGKTKCDRVSGAKWTGGECKCTTAGYVVNEAGTQCVKSDALIKTEGQATSRTKISSLYKKLNGMSNDFQVSVWKNAEGNFNTARLASDSIAAVVLGTTGALVTSNIVKKNQVSSGFEDINCQIGGQTVAGWGDEFSVGMQ